jgi:hypothetical protein
LGCHAAEFASQLQAAGYSPRGAKGQLWLMAHLSRWLATSGLSAADLDESRVEQYLMVRRAAQYRAYYTRAGLARLLDFLAEQGARPATRPPARDPAGRKLECFRRYLLSERGLAPETVAGYVARVGQFVADHITGGDVRGITAADISRAVVPESRRVRSVSAVQHFAAALRAFLRYCRQEGLIDVDLSAAAVLANPCVRRTFTTLATTGLRTATAGAIPRASPSPTAPDALVSIVLVVTGCLLVPYFGLTPF